MYKNRRRARGCDKLNFCEACEQSYYFSPLTESNPGNNSHIAFNLIICSTRSSRQIRRSGATLLVEFKWDGIFFRGKCVKVKADVPRVINECIFSLQVE